MLAWHCSQGNRKRTALRACSSSGSESLPSLRLVFRFSSEALGSRDLVAVELAVRPGRGQDPADPETLEAEIAPSSNAATRVARPPTTFSILAILVVMVATDCEHGERCNELRKSLRDDDFEFLLDCACGLSAHSFEFGNGTIKNPCSKKGIRYASTYRAIKPTRVSHENWLSAQNWVVDIWTRQNQKKTRQRENHRECLNGKWLEPEWLRILVFLFFLFFFFLWQTFLGRRQADGIGLRVTRLL